MSSRAWPAPRFSRDFRRALSMRMRRIASAAAPKKCARFCHDRSPALTSCSQASCTSAVGCNVCPAASCAIRAPASRRNASYTNGNKSSEALLSPRPMACNTRVISLIFLQ